MTAAAASPALTADTAPTSSTTTTTTSPLAASITSQLDHSSLLPVESALLELQSSQQSLQTVLSAARAEYYEHTHPLMLEQLVPAFAQLDVYCRRMDEVKARLQRVSKRVAVIKQRTAALDADVSSSKQQPVAFPPPPPAAAPVASSSSSAPASTPLPADASSLTEIQPNRTSQHTAT